ncbi:hypothetical protein T492DRAFT_905446 [Pavlovales sp. CCMP2436]|nr:hypothetical protein T492DRAFT_905446 [Pavlovales sp. CCMP2436]
MHRLGRGLILRAGPLAGGRVGRLRRLLSVAPRPVLWAPERNGEASRMAEFGRFVSGKEGRVEPGLGGGGFESYAALHAWSVADLRSFWGHLWDFCEVQHSASYTAVVDDPRLMSEAFLAYDELSDTPRVWTHEQLYADVAVLLVLSPYLPHSAIPDLEKLSPIARRHGH